ncbi:hypothetical protein, conserved [Eimeria tenella]|uniref:Transmembrane protein n=1 Tax=Eimeria tenella TaxID=5802 RepID=U6KMQ0_EIMTE|nr:hypothetical protein, conserved [Eimeria tenella]CDJ37552.1 hypothetical protein, conserved [Eimeria tenella]|eukprot:XP_013228390.1 hypothetical protein, conserved [Eimeria tenella]
MARATDSRHISDPCTSRERFNFSPVLLEHLESTESAHEVPTRVTRPVCAAPHKSKVVILCMLAVVALTVSFFRICYEWRGHKDVRRLSSKFPRGEKDPELSQILDMCLDMEEDNQNVSPTLAPVSQTQPIGRQPPRSTLQHQHSQQSPPSDSMPEEEYFITQPTTSFLRLLEEPMDSAFSGYYRSKETSFEEYPARSTPEEYLPMAGPSISRMQATPISSSDIPFRTVESSYTSYVTPPANAASSSLRGMQGVTSVMQRFAHLPEGAVQTSGSSALQIPDDYSSAQERYQLPLTPRGPDHARQAFLEIGEFEERLQGLQETTSVMQPFTHSPPGQLQSGGSSGPLVRGMYSTTQEHSPFPLTWPGSGYAHQATQEHSPFPLTRPGSGPAHQASPAASKSLKRPLNESGASSSYSPPAQRSRGEEQTATAMPSTSLASLRDDVVRSLLQAVSAGASGISILGSLLRSYDSSADKVPETSKEKNSEIALLLSKGSVLRRMLPCDPAITNHPFYKLPEVAPGIKVRRFSPSEAFSRSNLLPQVSTPLESIRSWFRMDVLDETGANRLVVEAERVVCNLYFIQQKPVPSTTASRAVLVLGQRYLMLDALVSTIQVLGPTMNASRWWPKLVGAIPTEILHRNFPSPFERTRYYETLALRLIKAIELLKKGVRLEAWDTVELKRELFCKKTSPRWFKTFRWDSWRTDDKESSSGEQT